MHLPLLFDSNPPPRSGATDIARKPNYDFERRERERNKAAESEKKAQAKADKRAAEQGAPDADQWRIVSSPAR